MRLPLAAAGAVLTAAAFYLLVTMSVAIDDRYQRSRFTLPPYACPIAIFRDGFAYPWCTEDRWNP